MESGWTDMAVSSQYNVMNAAQIQQYYNDALKNFAEINPTGANNLSQANLGHPMIDAISFANELSPLFFWNPGSDIDTNWKKKSMEKEWLQTTSLQSVAVQKKLNSMLALDTTRRKVW